MSNYLRLTSHGWFLWLIFHGLYMAARLLLIASG